MKTLWALLPAMLLAAAGETESTEGLPPSIRVVDHGGAARDAFPVSGSIPLPRGAVQEEDLPRLGLRSAAGKEIPLQARAVGHWLDGSVKWLLLDFASTQAAGRAAEYRLVKAAARRGAPLGRSAGNRITVDTGKLKASFDAGGCRITVGGRTVVDRGFESKISLRDRASGRVTEYRLPVAGGVIEENGPERAVVRIRGWHEARGGDRFSPSDIRLVFTRGQPFVRVLHTFVMSRDPKKVTIPRMALDLKTPTPFAKASFVGRSVDLGRDRVGVFQEDRAVPVYPPQDRFDPRFRIFAGKGTLAEGERYPGSMVLTGGRGGLGVFLKDMWQSHPKTLSYSPASKTVSVEFWPGAEAGDLDLRRMEVKRPQHYRDFCAHDELFKDRKYSPERYCAHDLDHSAMGVARTHEVVLDFAPEGGRKDPGELAKLFDAPLVPFVSGEWNVSTGAIGKQVLPGTYRKDAEAAVGRMFDLLFEEIDSRGWYGEFIYGNVRYSWTKTQDRWMNYHPKYAWYNSGHCEGGGTLLRSLWIQYLRTGDPKLYSFALAQSRHRTDVSVVHYHERDRVGMMIRHSGFDPWSGNRHWSGAHATMNGLFMEYYLTGNARVREVLTLTGDKHYQVANFDFGRNRDTDLDSMALYYELTRDEKHYQRCVEYIDDFVRKLDAFTRKINDYSYYSYWQPSLLRFYRVCEEKGDRATMGKIREVFLRPYARHRLSTHIPQMLQQSLGFAYELDPNPRNAERLLGNVDAFVRLTSGRLGWTDGLALTNMNGFGFVEAIYYGLEMAREIEWLAPPTVVPGGGTFPGSISIRLDGDTGGGEIRYTTDGSTPTASSPRYAGPITVDRTMTVKARRFAGGKASPRTAVAAFSIGGPDIPRDGLELWLRADRGVTVEGGGVARWADQSGRGREAVQDRPKNRPTFVKGALNGHPVIRGSAGRMTDGESGGGESAETGETPETGERPERGETPEKGETPRPETPETPEKDKPGRESEPEAWKGAENTDWGSCQEEGGAPAGDYKFLQVSTVSVEDCSLFFVASFEGSYSALVGDGDDGAFCLEEPGTMSMRFGAADRGMKGRGRIPKGFGVWTLVRKGASVRIYRNGVEFGEGECRPIPLNVKLLMSRRGWTGSHKGDLAETLIYGRALAAGERTKVERYLMKKYDLD